ncbi:hypothetical protein NPIL_606931 [Nephila pilipes]|uniref:Uncharacterized protein n=1 Tax=Nephila pilipes TaxID=299642 RepID=A0A8X6Q9E4_NEPPI|nr:hypothetical protein NPIL_606931 [Nephila pilipes]
MTSYSGCELYLKENKIETEVFYNLNRRFSPLTSALAARPISVRLVPSSFPVSVHKRSVQLVMLRRKFSPESSYGNTFRRSRDMAQSDSE